MAIFCQPEEHSSHIPKNYMIEKVFNCCTSINLLHYYCCIEIFTKGKNSHKLLFLLIVFLWKKNLKSKTMNSRFQCYYRNKFLLGVLSSRYYLEKKRFWSILGKSLNLSVPPFLHLYNANINSTNLIALLQQLKELIPYCEACEQR